MSEPAQTSSWPLAKKLLLWLGLPIAVYLIYVLIGVFRILTVGVPMAYHKQWAFNFISEYQKKTGRWPTSWDEIERTIDTSSPHRFSDIKKNVSVKWENLGVIISDPQDYYIRSSPDTKWQGEDWNRDMIQLIKDRQAKPAQAPASSN